jgi:spermidine/putrescine transport system ATP-binding protein
VVNRPDVLLLDEPLGALDLKLRRQMQLELKRIQTEVGITFVHVTHDQEEAMTMADTIAVMNAGRIEQLGTPIDLYESPATAYVANFLGQSNLLPAAVADRSGGSVLVDVDGSRIAVPADRCRSAGRDVLVGVRPEKVQLERGASAPAGMNALSGGLVTDASFTGTSTQYVVRLPSGRQLTAFAQNTGRATVLPVGCSVTVCWDEAHTFGLDGAEDAAAGIETPDGPAAAARAGLPVGHVAGTGPGGAPDEPEAAPGTEAEATAAGRDRRA